MELGFFTMPLHPPGSDTTKTLDDDLEQMVILDKLGYKETYIGEHFTFTWENIPSPDLFIAKAVAMTENIIFGTGITCMPIHNPASYSASYRAVRPSCTRTFPLGCRLKFNTK